MGGVSLGLGMSKVSLDCFFDSWAGENMMTSDDPGITLRVLFLVFGWTTWWEMLSSDIIWMLLQSYDYDTILMLSLVTNQWEDTISAQ